MHVRRALLGVVLLAVVLQGSLGGYAQERTVRIGFFAPITGPAAADGASARQGAELAVNEVNRAGGAAGRRLELIVQDDRLNANEAIAVSTRLIEQDRVLVGVSGSYSGPTRAAAPVWQRSLTPLVVAYATHPEITKTGNYIFRLGVLGSVEAAAGAEAARKLLGAQTVVVLFMDNDVGRNFSASFRAHAERIGLRVLASEVFPLGERDYTPLLLKVRPLNPDLLYVVAYYSEAALIARAARQLGVRSKLLGMQGWDSPKFLELAGEAAEGTYFTTTFDRGSTDPQVRRFMQAYEQAYRMPADIVSASTYNAIQVVAHVLRGGAVSKAQVREGLARLRNFRGILGVIERFTPQREVVQPVYVQQVRAGRFASAGAIRDPSVIEPK